MNLSDAILDQMEDDRSNLQASVKAFGIPVVLTNGREEDAYDYLRGQICTLDLLRNRAFRREAPDYVEAAFIAYRGMLDGEIAWELPDYAPIIEAICRRNVGVLLRAIADCAVDYVLDGVRADARGMYAG